MNFDIPQFLYKIQFYERTKFNFTEGRVQSPIKDNLWYIGVVEWPWGSGGPGGEASEALRIWTFSKQ